MLAGGSSSLRLVARRGGVAASVLVAAGGVGAAAGATAVASGYTLMSDPNNNTNDENASSSNNIKRQVVLPTLQATGRALRLVQTALLMTADYQMAAFWQQRQRKQWWQLPKAEESRSAANNDDDNDAKQRQQEEEEEQLVEYWEEQVRLKQQALQDAQAAYTAPATADGDDASSENESHHQNDDAQKLKRRKRYEEKKELMWQAATELVHAEEQLERCAGGDGSSSSPRSMSRKSRIHRRAAQRILDLCHANKGVYIKVGQHLANLDYLLPAEYIQTLAALFDDNPVTSYENVCAVIQQELGAHPDVLFDAFDPTPLASASLAQVHVAYEKGTGRKLAVKVQHMGLRETAVGDVQALSAVVQMVEHWFPDFHYYWICEEIQKWLPQELDFVNEARNAERAAVDLQTTNLPCVVPAIVWPYTSSRVLTMEFEEGFAATNVQAIDQAGLSRAAVAGLISSVFAHQIFQSGWVHSDPHQSNVLIRPSQQKTPEMVLVDHGLYRELDPEFKRHYAALWKALLLADVDGIQQACANMDLADHYPLFCGLLTARPFDEVLERSKTKSLHHRPNNNNRTRGTNSKKNTLIALSKGADEAVIRGYAQRYFGDILRLLGKVPRQMLLLLKTADCLRHIDMALMSNNSSGGGSTTMMAATSSLVISGKYAARAVYQDECRQAAKASSSWLARFRAWWHYMGVVLRIRIHETLLQLSASSLGYHRLLLPSPR